MLAMGMDGTSEVRVYRTRLFGSLGSVARPVRRRWRSVARMIVYEQNLWESGETYYFRSSMGKTPICRVARCDDGWELLFYRGAANPGPYRYRTFEKAKAHVIRYLRGREDQLSGEHAVWARADHGVQEGQARSIAPLTTTHPRRARKDRHWAMR